MKKISEIPKNCNFGIGTFEELDGELLLIDGDFYQLKADGLAYKPNPELGTPFAVCAEFQSEKEFELKEISDLINFQEIINKEFPERNLPILIRFDGEFEMIHVRSVPKQTKPYTPFGEILKNQPVFTHFNIKGTLIGFRFPQYFNGLNIVGYHLHFISNDLKYGGHLLTMKVLNGKFQISESNNFNLLLPNNNESFTSKVLNVNLGVQSFNGK